MVNILLSTFNPLPANNVMMAKSKVRSAIFDPNSMPRPNEGIPLSAALMDMKVSGRTEMTAMMINPTVYVDKR